MTLTGSEQAREAYEQAGESAREALDAREVAREEFQSQLKADTVGGVAITGFNGKVSKADPKGPKIDRFVKKDDPIVSPNGTKFPSSREVWESAFAAELVGTTVQVVDVIVPKLKPDETIPSPVKIIFIGEDGATYKDSNGVLNWEITGQESPGLETESSQIERSEGSVALTPGLIPQTA